MGYPSGHARGWLGDHYSKRRLIAAAYSEEDLSNKARCKDDLQKALGLPAKAMVRRFVGMVKRPIARFRRRCRRPPRL